MKLQRSSGILAHITSFPSKYGIGDLGHETFNFIDFLHNSNQKLWQVLPLVTTSYGDSPYQSFSTFAGNHLLISLDSLVDENYLSHDDLINIPHFDENKIDYGKVIGFKMPLFKKAFENFKLNCSNEQNKNFEKFCSTNKSWLDDFSLFISLKFHFINERDQQFEPDALKTFRNSNKNLLTEQQILTFFYGATWNSWPTDISLFKPSAVSKWSKLLADDIQFYKFLQYEYFRQWNKVKVYANNKNISIIGDIPIFVAMDSCDVWANKHLFQLDKNGNPTSVAGVPPDYFSSTGQLWGNPLFDWKACEKENFNWWVTRVHESTKIYDIIRIDHFRAFDTYWAIPYGEKTAIKGKWIKAPGYKLFATLKKQLGDLPIIAEDLGDLNLDVAKLRDDLGFPGMKILQFAFDDDEENDYLPHNIENTNCVIYTGTHDNDTTRGWFNNSTEKNRDHFRRYMNVNGHDPAYDLIRLCFSSVAKYSIIPIQDLMRLDSNCRMNTPGVPSGNWAFRFTSDMLTKEIEHYLTYLTKLFHR